MTMVELGFVKHKDGCDIQNKHMTFVWLAKDQANILLLWLALTIFGGKEDSITILRFWISSKNCTVNTFLSIGSIN